MSKHKLYTLIKLYVFKYNKPETNVLVFGVKLIPPK